MTHPELSGWGALRPRARLIRTLGTDLISSEKVALIELVKSSFDADASVVLIRFLRPLTEGQGPVEVWDDGHGMDVWALRDSWLDIATDAKKRRTRSESGGRRFLGEKGIGRLAAARLAREMLMTTGRADATEVNLLIDWNDFDRENAYLDEIEVAWEVGAPTVFAEDGAADRAFADADQHRLVLIAPRGDDGYGFDVRSLQELMAAMYVTTGPQDLVTARLRAVAPSPHWRNTWLFAAGGISPHRKTISIRPSSNSWLVARRSPQQRGVGAVGTAVLSRARCATHRGHLAVLRRSVCVARRRRQRNAPGLARHQPDQEVRVHSGRATPG